MSRASQQRAHWMEQSVVPLELWTDSRVRSHIAHIRSGVWRGCHIAHRAIANVIEPCFANAKLGPSATRIGTDCQPSR